MPKKITTEEFIQKGNELHNNKYDYSKTDLNNKDEKGRVLITCPIHGDFWQLPNNHINRAHPRGCSKCNGGVPLSKEEFVERAKELHGNYYDYGKTDFDNKDGKGRVLITCPIHGDFWQLPSNHINRTHPRGCSKCNGGVPLTNDELVKKWRIIHNDRYIYTDTDISNKDENGRVLITCPIHGDFWQSPYLHTRGCGCPECWKEKDRILHLSNKDEFISKAIKIHSNKYDYSNVKYVNSSTCVDIICKTHGVFRQTPNKHLGGCGCPKCAFKIYDTESFINEARKIHGNKYVYDKVIYDTADKKVVITCPKHGDFLCKPSSHINGRCGCPKCNMSHLEEDIEVFLTKNGIRYENEKKFEWLGNQELDFYLPDYNTAIECQGIQHFKENGFFNETLDVITKRDTRKRKLCLENGVNLVYFSNLKIDYPYKVFTVKEKMLEEIKKLNQIINKT